MTRFSRGVVVEGACHFMALSAAPASGGPPMFHPRVRNTLGLRRLFSARASSPLRLTSPAGLGRRVTYHEADTVMAGWHHHALDLLDRGHQSVPQASCCSGAPADYVGMMERLYTDVAQDGLGTANVFSVLPQFAQGTSPGAITLGRYSLAFDPQTLNDVVMDNDPYPPVADQCRSPDDAAVFLAGRPGAEPGRPRHLQPRRGAGAARHLDGVPAARRGRVHHRGRVRDQLSSAPITRSATSATAPRSTPWWSTRS